MVTYGPWFQPPDYQMAPTGTTPIPIGPPDRPVYGIYEASSQYAPDPIIINPSHIVAYVADVGSALAATEGADTGPDLDQARFRAHHGNGLVIGGPETTYVDTHRFERGVYGEKRFLTIEDVEFNPAWLIGSDEPENAIDYEVEKRNVGGVLMEAGVLVAADVTVFAGVVVGVAPNAQVAPIDVLVQVGEDLAPSDWRLEYAADPATARASTALQVNDPGGENVVGTIHVDLTGDQEDLPGEWGVLPLWAAVSTRAGSTGFLYDQDDDFENHDVTISADVTFNAVYTIRPPRVRWILDRTPYRRIAQRGDGLAGGARRVGGRVKTIQGSNRRGAGSVV